MARYTTRGSAEASLHVLSSLHPDELARLTREAISRRRRDAEALASSFPRRASPETLARRTD